MESHFEEQDPTAPASLEENIQQKFAAVLPAVTNLVDINKAVEDTFKTDIATDKIRKVFLEEIEKDAFANKVKEVVAVGTKVQRYDGIMGFGATILKWGVIAFLGYAIPTWVLPYIIRLLT